MSLITKYRLKSNLTIYAPTNNKLTPILLDPTQLTTQNFEVHGVEDIETLEIREVK